MGRKRREKDADSSAEAVKPVRSRPGRFSRFLAAGAVAGALSGCVPDFSGAANNKPAAVAKTETATADATRGPVQNSVNALNSFSLEQLKRFNLMMDSEYDPRLWRVWRTKDAPASFVGKIVFKKSQFKLLSVFTGVDSTTGKKNLFMTDGFGVSSKSDLQKLYGYYVEACRNEGREPEKNPWIKVILKEWAYAVDIFVAFVDDAPKPGYHSDLKAEYPVIKIEYRDSGTFSEPKYFRLVTK
jgi:hypothetical protein